MFELGQLLIQPCNIQRDVTVLIQPCVTNVIVWSSICQRDNWSSSLQSQQWWIQGFLDRGVAP